MRNHLLDLLASLYVAGTIVFTVACLEGLTHCVSLTGSHCSCLFTLTVLVLRYVHTVLSLSHTAFSLSTLCSRQLSLCSVLWFTLTLPTLTLVACFEGCIIACTSTCLYWYYAPEYAVSMSWTVVSLAVVFPLSSCIGMGFKRR